MKFVELERVRSEVQEKMVKLQQEADTLTQQLEEAETKASAAIKSASTIEGQLSESQQLLEEETRQKLALSSKLRQIESEKEALQEQLEEDEEMKKNFEKKMNELTSQMQEMKKKADEEGLKLINCLEVLFINFISFHIQPTLSRNSKSQRKNLTRTSKRSKDKFRS